jgi:hypothetical protein
MAPGARTIPYERSEREFWKPQLPATFHLENCEGCGNELVIGSRFCHLCGHERDAHPQMSQPRLSDLLNWTAIRTKIGLSTFSLLLTIVGFACVVAALVTGFLFTAQTALDWQAVQTWRIEWMLAALVAFTAAILFRKS